MDKNEKGSGNMPPISRPHAVLLACAALSVAGCAAQGGEPLDDGSQVVGAVMATLASDGKPICADKQTRGQPLAIYRTMTYAPPAARRPLAWHAPGPLRPPRPLSRRDLYEDQIGGRRVYLREPGSGMVALPAEDQRRFDSAARAMSVSDFEPPKDVAHAYDGPGLTARWWLFNRFRRDCSPTYTLTSPVIRDDIAFMSVTAGHWGTTYAVVKQGNEWRTAAQWSNWLY